MRPRSIEWHLALLCIALAVPILTFVGWLSWQYTGLERLRLEQQRLETLEQATGALDRDLGLLKAMAELAATAPLLSGGNQPAIEESLRELSRRLGMEVALRSTGGQAVAVTAPERWTERTGLQEEEREALELKRAVVAVRASERPGAAPDVIVTAPVFRPGTQEPVQVLSFLASAERVQRALGQAEPAPGVTTTVLDPTGLAIATHGAAPGGAPGLSPLSLGASGASGRYAGTAQDGTPVVVEYTRLRNAEWTVAASVPEEALRRPFRRFVAQLLGTVLTLAVLAAALAYLFARQIFRALARLRNAAAALGQMEPVAEIGTGIKQVDEVGEALLRADRAIRAGQEQQALMNRELHHRVKNTIATIQALIRLSARSANSAEALRDTLTSRIASLSATHDLLLGSGWAGASLDALLRAELDPYQDPAKERVRLDGPPAELPPDIALALSMIVHELATNAAKYGALSGPDGRLTVTWELDEVDGSRTLSLAWKEAGMAPVGGDRKQGFGSDLLDRLAQGLGATVTRDFSPAGLNVDLRVPLGSKAP